MTLGFARSLPVAPGTNVRGEQADTSWLFLLPSLELGEVLVVGSAPLGTLKALAPLGSRIAVSRPSAAMRRRIATLAAGTVEVETGAPAADGSPAAAPGLVYVGAGSPSHARSDRETRQRLAAAIEAGGSIYLEPGGFRARRAAAALARSLGAESCVVVGTGRGPVAGTTAAGGPVAWAVPAQTAPAVPLPRIARRAIGFAARRARRILTRSSGDARVSDPDSSLGVEGIAALGRSAGRGRGLLLRSAGEGGPAATPAYLLEAARAARFPLSERDWRLAPPRGYRSQKVIFFAGTDGDRPAVVKLTQDPAFNVLLDNEADALEALAGTRLDDGPTIPELHFRARHAGLAVVAQSALAGRPFVEGASRHEWDRDAAAVAAAITTLGLRTSRPAGGDLAEALGEVTGQFTRLYRPPTVQSAALAAAVAELAALGEALPVVFMHGDATVFNVLLAPDLAGEDAGAADSAAAGRRVGLVDWENAEPGGMPLWDLFHFLQAHAAWQAGASGGRYTPATFADQAVGPGAARHAEVVAAYCAALGVPPEAVAPLRLLWLARHAVREARQLPPERLGEGLYQRMLAAIVDHPG